MQIRVGSDAPFRLTKLRNVAVEPAVYVNDATVMWQLYDRAGAAVSGVAGSMTLVDGSTTGDYEGVVSRDDTEDLAPRREYSIVATVEKDGLRQDFPLECVAVARHKEN